MTDLFNEPLRDVVRRHNLRADKRYGQHFIFDANFLSRIARAAGPLETAHIYEIGPGPGGLTRALLNEGAAAVTAVETDERFMPHLEALAQESRGRLSAIWGDALATAPPRPAPGRELRIAANLPYNIATPLMAKLLTLRPIPWDSMTIMVQKEVGERMYADSGTKNYGRLSVLVQAHTRVSYLFAAPPQVFTPPPKVDSIVLRLEPTKMADTVPSLGLQKVTSILFSQRRKMLRQSLKPLAKEHRRSVQSFLEEMGAGPTDRADQVEVDSYIRLAHALAH